MPSVASSPAAAHRAAPGSGTGADDRQPAGAPDAFVAALAALAVPAPLAPVADAGPVPASDPAAQPVSGLVAAAAAALPQPAAQLGATVPATPLTTQQVESLAAVGQPAAPQSATPLPTTTPQPPIVPSAAPQPAGGQTGPQPVAAPPAPGTPTTGTPTTGLPSAGPAPAAGRQPVAPQPVGSQPVAPQPVPAQAGTAQTGTAKAARPAGKAEPAGDVDAITGQPTAAVAAPASSPVNGGTAQAGDDRPGDSRRDPSDIAAPAAATAVAAPAAPAPAIEVTAPAAPAQPATPLQPATQVAMHIVPLRREADGVHRLTVHLHPEDLGPVQVVAEVRDGGVSVQLASGTEAGRAALHDALPQLRQELQDAGFGNCNLDLRQDSPGTAPEYRQQNAGRPAWTDAAAAGTPAEAEVRPTADRNRLLDLRV